MLKISCDRYVPLAVLKSQVEEICFETTSGKGKMLRSDVVGFDNKFYTVYIKKNDKSYSHRAVKTSKKPNLLPKMATMSEGMSISNFTSNFNSNNRLANVCYQLYTSS